jgi:hypothetical protein
LVVWQLFGRLGTGGFYLKPSIWPQFRSADVVFDRTFDHRSLCSPRKRKKEHRFRAGDEENEAVVASASASADVTGDWQATQDQKSTATRLRLFAVLCWIVAIRGEIAGIYLLFQHKFDHGNMPLLIGFLVGIAVFAIADNLLWKAANRSWQVLRTPGWHKRHHPDSSCPRLDGFIGNDFAGVGAKRAGKRDPAEQFDGAGARR